MTALNVRQTNLLLRLLRADKLESLGEEAIRIAPIQRALSTLMQQQSIPATARQRGLIARQLIETAIRSLSTDPRDRDHRAYTLLNAFYLQHHSRAETLARLKLSGGSFDRVKANAIGKLTDALNQLCATSRLSSGARELDPEADGRKCQHLPYRPYRVLWGRDRQVNEVLPGLSEPTVCR